MPAIDYDALESIYGEADATGTWLLELIQTFLTHTKEKFLHLNQLMSEGNLESINKLGHLLKSSSAYMGAKRLQQLCSDLEKAKNLEEASILIPQIHSEYDVCAKELETYLAKRAS